MPSDPRVSAVDHFTPTLHQAPYAAISPSTVSLPQPYTVCIVGASRGIGAGIARAYALAGASTLVLAARSVPALDALAAELQLRRTASPIQPAKDSDADADADADAPCPRSLAVHVQRCDVSSDGSVASLAAFVSGTCGARLDVLVLNAGVSGPVALKLTDADPAIWAHVFGVNTLGTYHCARHFVPLLLATPGGAKVFAVVGSIAACVVSGQIANAKYCVSKMAQARVVEYLAQMYGGEGLLSLAVHPGAVETRMAVETAPDAFLKYLTDDVELCGAFLVWLTKRPADTMWLSGRLVSANWDVGELMGKRDEVVEKDLLKFELKTC
ncbi:putative short-chain dehydrogenases/reductase [Saccharata proteae CBS 121410]|uniref:Short-chain dehydrogenases/reductase n=1 Tax=Saccharata proteae CBS 121410 TaxID=1314787 RepID=A0A9P4I171_9PEZI|nr:putative short-chain dehydrogenases/reductase [Saccharata proteae CBS 121410]